MPMLKLMPKSWSRSRRAEKDRLEALERLHAHFAAVDNLIRAFEEYKRFGPGRECQTFNLREKCS